MYRNSRLAILLPILLAAAVVLGLLLGRYLGRNTPEAQLRNLVEQLTHPTNKLAYTLSLIETEYVDSVSMDSLSEQVIPLLMEELDPHSVYIPKSEMEAVNEPLQGEFDGIGVVFNMAPDTVIVLNVIPSGPSDKAGVKAGDRIIRINDSLVAGQKIPNNEIVKRLRGKRGTQVKLSLERQGIAEPVEVEVTRGAIPIKSLEAAFMLPDSIGYIKLSQFAITSHNELITALNNLKAQGMKRLIFDLRGNPGGFLDQAIRIANEFLPADKLIVYTEDRNHNRTDEMSDGNGTIQELPPGGADRRIQRLLQRNSGRSAARQRPGYDHRTPLVRQRTRTTADTLSRRFGPAAHRRTLLYSHRSLDPKTLHQRRCAGV